MMSCRNTCSESTICSRTCKKSKTQCFKQNPPEMPLVPLRTQSVFEAMWFHPGDAAPLAGTRSTDRAWILYHTASWCGACKRLDIPTIVAAAERRGLTVWKIDVDENEYTSGFCGVRSIPTFQFCVPRKIASAIQSGDTAKVLEWIAAL